MYRVPNFDTFGVTAIAMHLQARQQSLEEARVQEVS